MGTLPFELEARNVVFRKEYPTNPHLGCVPSERKTEDIINYGIINVDKPKGPTSHMVSDYVQKIIHIDKAGHSGTLDPAVTGVLPTALGRGTRIVSALLGAGKEYVAVMHLHEKVDEKVLRDTINKSFLGPIRQMPPIKSSVKRQWRTRSIYYFDILEIDGQDVLFKVGTEAGTYIRKLIHDLGQKLKAGAHMAELRRTKAGPFPEDTSFTLHELSDAYHFWKEEQNDKFIRKVIQPVENGAAHLKKIWVFDSTVESMCHGSDLKVPGISKLHDNIQKDDIIAIMTLKDELVALGTAQMPSEEMTKDKGIAATTDKVFMAPGAYKIS
jgi:H/ACA ribonucleoprotein complex subunit 4